MLEAEYSTMFAAEQSHWWYLGLHDQVRRAVARCREEACGPLRLLDAGCGTGKVLSEFPDDRVTGLDLSATALSLARKRGDFPLARASIAQLPFREAAFDVVVSLDVLSNLPPAALGATLADMRRVLVPGGRLILNTAAHQSLYSEHDRAVGVVCRYTTGQIRDLLAGAGFGLELLSYSNTLLFPVAALVRLWRKRHLADPAPHSDLAPLPPRLNAILARTRCLENAAIIRYGLPMPFGLSIFAIARNPARSRTPFTRSQPTR